MTWGDHVGLQECAFQIDMVATQSLVDSSQYLPNYILIVLQAMVQIKEDFRLHNGYIAILLADAGVTNQHIGIFNEFKG